MGLGLLGRSCGSGKGVEQRVSLVRVRVCSCVCVWGGAWGRLVLGL